MTVKQMDGFEDDKMITVAVYQVSSAERFNHINNEMFMNGSCDSNSHSPLMVYARSRAEAKELSVQRAQERRSKKNTTT